MKNKTKKILAGACLGLVGLGCLTGCEKKQDFYELTVINDSQYGIISPILDNETNSVRVERGDNYTFTITPIEGYEIDKLIIDGKLEEPQHIYTYENEEVELQSIYTFRNIEKDHSIGAIYTRKIRDYSIVGIYFNAYYKESSNYSNGGAGDSIKLKVCLKDSHNVFIDGGYEILLSENSNAQGVMIGQDSSDLRYSNISFVSNGTIYENLRFCNLDNSNGEDADIKIKSFINPEDRGVRYTEDGYYSSQTSQLCTSNIKKIDGTVHEDLYSISVDLIDNKLYLVTTSGKDIVAGDVRLICKANYY